MRGSARSTFGIPPGLIMRWLLPLAVAATGTIGALPASAATPETAGVFVPHSFSLHLQNQTATLLNNGTVLIAGGVDGSGTVQSAATIYDPATGTTTALANHMTAARQGHTATLLSDGRVLIAGGSSTTNRTATALASAEIYDPVAQTFTSVGAMTLAHALHTATLLVDGTVLIAGGYCASTCTTGGGGNSQAGISLVAEIFDPSTSNFTGVGAMRTTLAGQTAVRLGDGTVLLAGGISAGNPGGGGAAAATNAAESYRPNTQTFASTGSMTDSRVSHSATLLNDGTVLIAGGASGPAPMFQTNALPSAEIYTPSTGKFALTTGTMTTPRTMHAASLMSDGTVLIVGGEDDTQTALTTAETYNPSTQTFMPTAARMDSSRAQFTATTLVDGTVLIAGGAASAANSVQLDLFDGAPGTFVATGSMSEPRQFHTATMLSDGSGRVLVTGGHNDVLGALESTDIYDGASFTPGPTMTAQRYLHAAAAFPNGSSQQALITGGVTSGGVSSSADLYTAQAGATGTIAAVTSGGLSDSRFGHTATYLAPIPASTTIPNGGVLIVGGEDALGVVLKTTDLFVLDGAGGGTFNPGGRAPATKKPKTSSSHELGTARVYHTATTLCDGTVLIAGGIDPTGNYLTSAELYDPNTDGFTNIAGGKTGGMFTARAFHTAQLLLPSCNVLITGGFNSKGVVSAAELYIPGVPSGGKPTLGKFVAIASMNTAREDHTASLLPDGSVLLAGGKSGTTTVEGSGEIYDPILQTFSPTAGSMVTPRVGHAAVPLNSGFVLLTGGEDDSFTATAGAELYDPPSGPHSTAAMVTAIASSKKAGAGRSVNAGTFTISNSSGAYESISSVSVALSNPSLFSSITVGGIGGGASVSSPGSSTELTFDPPIALAPGSAVRLQFSGTLAKHQHGESSVQGVTGVTLSSDAPSTVGLPATLGSITEK